MREIQKLPRPSKRNVKVLQEWLERPEGGDFFLRGREAEIWDQDKDLVTLSNASANRDRLTGLITDSIIPWYHCRLGYRFKVRSIQGFL